MGLGTVAVYSDADVDAPHVRLADRAIRLGPPPARDSYLVIERLIAAAVLIPAMLLVLWVLNPMFALMVAPIFALCLGVIGWGGLRLVP